MAPWSVLTADFVLNTLLYGLYFILWASTTAWFAFHSRKRPTYLWGVFFISSVYWPAQITPIFWNPERLIVFDFILLCIFFAAYKIFPNVERDLRLTGNVAMGCVLAMMFVSALMIVTPGFMDFLAEQAGTIEGYALTRGFIHTQLENALYVLLCISAVYFSRKDRRECLALG